MNNSKELPKYHQTFIPILKVLSDGKEMKSKDLYEIVRDTYYSDLSNELLEQKTSSGKSVIIDRIAWGKSYLKVAKYLESPKRGNIKISEKGVLGLESGSVTLDDIKKDPDFIKHRSNIISSKSESDSSNLILEDDSDSPQDLIDKGFGAINRDVKSELLERLKEIDPYYFEKVILILLQKMGYGDFIETSKSNDGGIDGIINEDKLGLERIYTQAKRYNENKIREKDIRNFIGAMSGDTNKGVFITTSSFDSGAIKKAKEAHHTIILIDGNKLVDLMLRYNVGVQVKSVYEIKELDNDFFEES